MAVKKNGASGMRSGGSVNRRIMELTSELKMLTKGEGLEDDLKQSNASNGGGTIGDLESRIDRLLRLKEVLEYIPVGKSTWWAGVKSGRYPSPVHHLGPRITAWSLSSILRLINGGEGRNHAQ